MREGLKPRPDLQTESKDFLAGSHSRSVLVTKLKTAALLQGSLRELDGAVVLSSAIAGKTDGENNDDVVSAHGSRQSETLDRLLGIDCEGVTVEKEGAVILCAIVNIAIGGSNGDRFSRIVLGRKPVADALGIRGSGIIGVGDDKVLRGQVTVDCVAQKIQRAVTASGERDNDVLPGIQIVGWSQGESGAVPGDRRA